MTNLYHGIEPPKPSYYGESVTELVGERTVAQRIFYDRFWVLVPEYFYQTKESLAMYGTYSTGDKHVDRQLMLQKRRLYIPIAGMCIYLEEGAELTLDTPTDSIIIYQLITEHLKNWEFLTGQMNAPIAPIEDLRVMDLLAEMLYPAASIYTKQNLHHTGFWARLDRLGQSANTLEAPTAMERLAGLTGGPMQRAPQNTDSVDSDAKPVDKGHTTIADVIAKQTFRQKWSD